MRFGCFPPVGLVCLERAALSFIVSLHQYHEFEDHLCPGLFLQSVLNWFPSSFVSPARSGALRWVTSSATATASQLEHWSSTPTVACPATANPCKQTGQSSRPAGMYHILQQRSRDIISDLEETLIGICLDPRLMPNVATSDVQRTVRSSASTPSLRARDGSIPMHARMDPGGNVRVVVRVRAFLPRGEFSAPRLHHG